MPFWLIQIVIAVSLELLSVALAPKPAAQTPTALQPPTASAGSSLPKVFGTITVTGTNTLWFGDILVGQRSIG